MNPLKVLSPWLYYVGNALVSNLLVIPFIGIALIGKLEDTYPAWIYGADYTQIFWPCFLIHVSTATLFSILSVYHDMISHPEFFREQTNRR